MSASSFDDNYMDYGRVLHDYVHGTRVDYASLKGSRATLDAAVAAAGRAEHRRRAGMEPRAAAGFLDQRLQPAHAPAIVDHYPIRARVFTLAPRNSIRQIDGVWTKISWRAAGRTLTLDDIEHRILRPEFKEPRVHFAVNCASVGCPPLAAEPYLARTLDAQLDAAARRYLASERGLKIEGSTLSVTKILEWYGDDFVARFAPTALGKSDRIEQAIRGVVEQFGPQPAAALARTPSTRIKFLDYDWSLNDVK